MRLVVGQQKSSLKKCFFRQVQERATLRSAYLVDNQSDTATLLKPEALEDLVLPQLCGQFYHNRKSLVSYHLFFLWLCFITLVVGHIRVVSTRSAADFPLHLAGLKCIFCFAFLRVSTYGQCTIFCSIQRCDLL